MKKLVVFITVLSLACLITLVPRGAKADTQEDPVRDYVTNLRGELSNGKATFINQVMNLSVEEAKIFWPIYYEYEKELFELGDHRLQMIKQFVIANKDKALDDAQAKTMATDWFKLQADRLSLFKKYHSVITKKLSAVRAAQFIQIEYRVNTMIDIMIAAELPLIQ
jgi:hypothetical protein